ncbi:hypothetical protein AGOR_G00215780, partial [Albula goreensis]
FTVVTRDSSVHGPGPILVKNILPRGAAIKDGRLQSGDRILEVNGVDITGRTQEELVGMLRSTKQGETVSLVVARQEEMFLPRELKGEQASPLLLMEEGKEQLMFEVPLNDSGSAGLGVSLKGNRSRETGEDLGIFIKSIIHGGAAYKDGRLRVNDQLIAVNGESLLGKSNHEAMETLRRSMSMEGNLRGMIQLVLVRPLERTLQENHEAVAPQSRALETPPSQPPPSNTADGSPLPAMVVNSIYDRAVAPELVPNGSHNHMDEEEDEEDFPPPPPRRLDDPASGPQRALPRSLDPGPYPFESSHPDRQQRKPVEHLHVKSSKSMDLVADESNVGSLAGQKSDMAEGRELGPTLGLKKSSSLESLQTAMSEVRKNELPFHRPRPHMVRGRGCNESFRAAIDKSYDGPPEDDDDLSDQSSGRDTPASGSSRQGLGDAEEGGKKDKKKKAKSKKKEKKSKGKEKEKKKAEDGEEQEKKTKRKGFGLLRFGKKKEDKAKAALQKQKSEVLSEEELDRMKEERERIEAKHQELRDQQARDRLPLPDVEDDDHDPNYARINNFRDIPGPVQYPHRDRTPSPQLPMPTHSREPSTENPIEGLYAKVNKQRPPPMPATDSADRIQQLRREYQQARREGAAPAYEELEARRRAQDYDPHRVPVRGHDGRLAPRYEDVERQYASLPRRGPMDPNDYPMQSWGGHREPAPYPVPQPGYPGYPSRDNYPRGTDRRAVDPRQGDPGYYPPPPQQRGPLRQDVPPSPTLPLRAPRYDTMNRGGYRTASPDHYAYGDGRNPDPRQTAAV